jgi:hypothetical protein
MPTHLLKKQQQTTKNNTISPQKAQKQQIQHKTQQHNTDKIEKHLKKQTC